MLLLADISDVAATAPWAFIVGCAVGFVIGARFRIERRNGKDRSHD